MVVDASGMRDDNSRARGQDRRDMLVLANLVGLIVAVVLFIPALKLSWALIESQPDSGDTIGDGLMSAFLELVGTVLFACFLSAATWFATARLIVHLALGRSSGAPVRRQTSQTSHPDEPDK